MGPFERHVEALVWESAFDRLIANIEVRRHNGQNEYGPWMPADAAGVPTWVGDLIGDERAEANADSGRVEQGGSIWVWRVK